MMKLLGILLLSLWSLTSAAARDGGIESLRATGKAFSAVAKKVAPSVVFIQVEEAAEEEQEPRSIWPFGEDLFRRFFGDDFGGFLHRAPQKRPRPVTGQGSGFVFAQSGETTYLLTNNHVVADAVRIVVRFQDGREFEARVRGTDPKSDVAVLEITARDIPTLQWGDSSQLEVGEWVVALGNPFGLSQTLTTGVVSAKGRTSLGINDYEDFIQTDAAINPGNSGGPLLNLDGEVVGMNTAIFSRSGGYMGVGFAIPSNLVRSIAEQIAASGRVVRGYVGLSVQPLTTEIVQALGLKQTQGVLVNHVHPGSPADRAGVHSGDVLVSFDGAELADGGQFRNRAALARPGSSVTLGVIRDGRRIELPVQVGQQDEEAILRAEAAGAIGVAVRGLRAEEAQRLLLPKAVLVTAVEAGSLAALAGIVPGTLILEVNRQAVGNAEEYLAALGKSGGSAVLRLSENGRVRQVTLRWR